MVGTSPKNDLAVIRVTDAKADLLKPATFAQTSSVVVGQTVVAVGAPLGLSETVTSGIVSATAVSAFGHQRRRRLPSDPDRRGDQPRQLRRPAGEPERAGDRHQRLRRHPVQRLEQSGSIGLGFAIPSDVAVQVASELIASGKASDAPSSGSACSPARPPTARKGVALNEVTAGRPAAAERAASGDVVTSVGEINVTANGLIAAVRVHAPGEDDHRRLPARRPGRRPPR
ncbi:MAG: S1C family serine protease [Micropruina sp.]